MLIRRGLGASALGLVALATANAGAQPPPAPPPPAATASPYPPCVKVPTDSDKVAAKGLHEAAKTYLAKALYEEAIAKWMEAYGFDCTKPQVFINIGTAYERLPGRTQKAIEAYETYVERAKNAGETVDPEIVEKIKNLKVLLAKEKAAAAGPPEKKPDHVDVAVDHGTGKVDTGPKEQEMKSTAGPWPWVVTGSGGGLLLVGAILAGVGASKVSSASEICGSLHTDCPTNPTPQQQSKIDGGNTGLTMERAGIPLVVVGAAAAIGGVVWYFVAPKKPVDGPAAAPAPKAAWELAPAVGPGNYGLSARLTF